MANIHNIVQRKLKLLLLLLLMRIGRERDSYGVDDIKSKRILNKDTSIDNLSGLSSDASVHSVAEGDDRDRHEPFRG